MMALALLAITASCKKSDNPTPPAGSGSLGAGKSSMSFNNTGSFAGGTTFSVSNTALTSAQSITNAQLRNVTLSASEVVGVNARITSLFFVLPATASIDNNNVLVYNYNGFFIYIFLFLIQIFLLLNILIYFLELKLVL